MLALTTTFACLVLTLPPTPQVSAKDQPNLNAVPLPILEVAQDNPEALWDFLVDPAMPYVEARAAAARCRPVFSLKLIRKLQESRWEL